MPAVAEEEDAILQDVQTILIAAQLAGIPVADFKIRELPKVGDTLDLVPCVLICSCDDLGSEPLDMEGNANRAHRVQICLVDGHEGDFATDRKKRQKWRKQALNAIEFEADGSWRLSLPNVPSVWSIKPVKVKELDRAKLAQNYAFFPMVVEFQSQE